MNKLKEFAKKPVFTMICATIANIIFVLVFGLVKCTDTYFETFAPGIVFPVLSGIYIISHIVGCFILRSKKMKNILKGVFLYELIGVICFIFYLIALMLNVNNLLDVSVDSILIAIPHLIFSWWVVFLEPLSTLVARLLGVWNLLIVAIMWIVLVYFTGKSILGIKKDREFEQRVKDRHLADKDKKTDQ